MILEDITSFLSRSSSKEVVGVIGRHALRSWPEEKQWFSTSDSNKEKSRKQQADGDANPDTADEPPTVKKQKINPAQSWLTDERADNHRLAEKALFTKAVMLTQRLTVCLHSDD